MTDKEKLKINIVGIFSIIVTIVLLIFFSVNIITGMQHSSQVALLSWKQKANDSQTLTSNSSVDASSISHDTTTTNSSTYSVHDTDANGKPDSEFIVENVDVDGNIIYLYPVVKGDTLTKVSRRVGYSVDEIAEYNHIKNVNLIYAGESLRVPFDADEIVVEKDWGED